MPQQLLFGWKKKEEGIHTNLKSGSSRKRKAGHIIQVHKQVKEMYEKIILTNRGGKVIRKVN